MRAVLFALAVLTVATANAYACATDSQCNAPDRCHFSARVADGLCLDSSQMPIEPHEKTRVMRPLKDRKLGDTCQFDVDCATGMDCFKRPGAAEGKCYEPPR